MTRRFLLLLSLLFVSAGFAAPAGSLIEAQASATYLDASNQPRSTTSNMVVTVVQQVYAVTVSPEGTVAAPGQSRTGLPGSSVDLAFTVRNAGNGGDTFALAPAVDAGGDMTPATTVVLDGNCNGRRDAGEASVAWVTLAGDASACVVIAAQVPASAVDGDEGFVALSVTSVGDGTVSGADTWSRVVAADAAVLSSFLLASPAGTVAAGSEIDFTLSGSNVGSFDAYAATNPLGTGTDGIAVIADVPAGFAFGTAAFDTGAGTGALHYFDGTTWSTTQGATVERVALLLTGTDGFFVQGAEYELRYAATVPGDASVATQAGDPLAGDVFLSTGVAQYATSNGGATVEADSNTVEHVVQAARHVAAGPFGLTTGTYTFGGRDIERTADAQSIALAYAGNQVSFRNSVRNLGNAADSFALSLSGAPAGWTCGTYAADGATPASTIGPIDALATSNVVVRCDLPANATTTDPSTVTLTATSVASAGVGDATTNTVSEVASGFGVSFTGAPEVVEAQPGETATFDLSFRNDGQNADTFTIETTATAFGPGSTVTFYEGCGAEVGSTPIASSAIVPAGGEACITAVVSVPDDATSSEAFGDDRDVTFELTSTNDASVTASVTHGVDVAHVPGVAFGPNRAATVTSPGVIDLGHTLRNTGNTSATASIPAVTDACDGCIVRYAVNEGAFEDAVAGLALAPGASADVVVRVTVPSGEPIGRRLAVDATASLDYGALGVASATVTDVIDVIGGELRLALSARTCEDAACTTELDATGANARPGDYVVYDVAADNLGTAPLQQVVVTDPLPAFTEFVSVEATASFAGTILYSNDGATWSATPLAGLATGESVYVAVDANLDGAIDADDTVPVAGAIDVRLVTRVE